MTDFGPNVATTAKHALARNNITLREARRMTDSALLSLTGLGRQSLAWIRAQGGREKCPTCGRPL